MLAKERKEDTGRTGGECCLDRAGCSHTTLSQRRKCCRIASCSHSPSRNGKVREDNREDVLPSPPPRGQSSVQTVQALKMRIEAGTPEMRRKILSNKKETRSTTPLRNGVKSRAETSSSRDVMTSRENLMTSRCDLRMSREDVVTSRGDLRMSREDVMTSRAPATVAQASSPNMSLRSEGSGRSIPKNHDEVPFMRTGGPGVLRMPSYSDTARTPISRTSGRQYVVANMPVTTADNDIDYMKEELVSRLMKEKEELLKLRKKKESERERMVELRREQHCRNGDETFETTPEPRYRLNELDRLNYIVQETPQKSDSSSNPSQSPDSGGFSPRFRFRDCELKSDAANRILFSEAHQRNHSPKPSDLNPTEKRFNTYNKDKPATKTTTQTTPISTTKYNAFHGRRPAPKLAKSVEQLNEKTTTPTKTTPTRRVTVTSVPSPTEHRPKNYEPLSMRTSPLRTQINGLRSNIPNSPNNAPSRVDFPVDNHVYQNLPATPTIGFHPIKTASSTSKINSTENSKSEEGNENYKTLPPELNSPFNERAVDCGPNSERTSERAVDCPAYERSFSLERGGKLSNQGYDVIRTVVRTEEEGGGEINPALLHPFRRRSRKNKEVVKENKDKCNTQ